MYLKGANRAPQYKCRQVRRNQKQTNITKQPKKHPDTQRAGKWAMKLRYPTLQFIFVFDKTNQVGQTRGHRNSLVPRGLDTTNSWKKKKKNKTKHGSCFSSVYFSRGCHNLISSYSPLCHRTTNHVSVGTIRTRSHVHVSSQRRAVTRLVIQRPTWVQHWRANIT